MSARAPIQVPVELKETVEQLAGKMQVKTNYEVIQNLIKYYESMEKWRREDAYQKEVQKQALEAERAEQKQKQRDEFIWVGKEGKERYAEFCDSLGIRSENNGVEFLLGHYDASDTFDKKTLQLLKNFR